MADAMATTLWHFTCTHGRDAIGTTGLAMPMAAHNPQAAARMLPEWAWLSGLVWFTDQPQLDPIALGLTSSLLDCDRMAWRYQVTDPTSCVRWLDYMRQHRRQLPRNARQLNVGDHRPGTWWVATQPVPVQLWEG